MLDEERKLNYDREWQGTRDMPILTRRQIKRARRKRLSRKTHSHDYLVVLTGERKGKKIGADGEIFRCLRCRPLPWRISTDIRPGAGPRDWTPGGA